MRPDFARELCCPDCGGDLTVRDAVERDGSIESGLLACPQDHVFPVRDFIPRFVGTDAYADAFTIEWTKFRTAHLDSFTGLDRLDREFRTFLDFPIERLSGKRVLDVGAGLGRFSEICLNHGARVVACDLSYAIDAARENLGHRPGIDFVQADVFKLPFRPETFDFAYSTGVLHHTPDPPAAFQHLPPLVRGGGKVMTMVYARYNKAYLAMVEFYRRFTTKLPRGVLLRLSYITVPLYYVSKIPAFGKFVTRILIPVSINPPNHAWRVGSTFDLYSPEYAFTYDHVQVFEWYKRAGLVEITPTGPESGVTYVGTKPPLDDSWS